MFETTSNLKRWVLVGLLVAGLLLTACGSDAPAQTPAPSAPVTTSNPVTTAAITGTTAAPVRSVAPTATINPAITSTAPVSLTASPSVTPVATVDPQTVLAEWGNGNKVLFADFVKFKQITLYHDLFFAQVRYGPNYTDDQIQQLNALQKQLDTAATTSADQPTLRQYLQNLIIVAAAKSEFGIDVTPAEAEQELVNEFGPLQSFSSEQLNANATASAVQHGVDTIVAATQAATTPFPTPTAARTLTPTTVPTGTLRPTVTPFPLTLEPSKVPTLQAEAAVRQKAFFDGLAKASKLGRDDYKTFYSTFRVYERKVDDRLKAGLPKIGEPYPQFKVSHILLKDEPTAQNLYAQLSSLQGEQLAVQFGQKAREVSLDRDSAARNGDLGWAVSTMYVPEFSGAVERLQVGQLSIPVKTNVGWHLILVTSKDDKRPLDAVEYSFLLGLDYGRSLPYDDWVVAKLQAANVIFRG